MKILKLFILFIAVSATVHAQNNKKVSVKDRMWNSKDKDFEITEVKEKWKNESAVILCKSIDYEVRKDVLVANVQENLYTRERIKLLDKAAVSEYSELTFDKSRSYQLRVRGKVHVGIKVIKPDGSEREINVNDAITMQISEGIKNANYKKIAIPDLEPGDIIDYYYCTESDIANNLFEAFSPVLYPLAGNHPINKQKINLHIMRKCYLNYKPMNGAPEMVLDYNKKKGDYNYQLVDEDRDKVEATRWMYSYRALPTLKFQAFFTTPKGMNVYKAHAIFLGNEGVAKTSVSDKELMRYLYTIHPSFLPSQEMNKFISSNLKKEKNQEKIAKEAYYFFRNREYCIGFEGDKVHMKNFRYGVNDYYFTKNMSMFLKKMKIPHDVIFTIPREIADVKDLVLYDEITSLIYVKTKEPFYMANFSRFSNYRDLPESLQGNNAFAINVTAKKKKDIKVSPVKLPVFDAKENADINSIEVAFNEDDMAQLKIKRDYSIKGYNKHYTQGIYVTNYDYIYGSKNSKYNNTMIEDMRMGKKEKAETLSKIESRKNQDNKDRDERIKNEIENSFSAKMISYEKLNLKGLGMWDEQPDMKFSDSFVLEGLVNKVGPNYMLEAGKLISKQVEVSKKELDRSVDVYLPVARTYEYKISIDIPDGYVPQGLENFNYDVTNNTGGFVSSAVIEGSKVVITTNKYYSSNEVAAADWPKMVEFLDAAYAFTQQKLLFKKGNLAVN